MTFQEMVTNKIDWELKVIKKKKIGGALYHDKEINTSTKI